ncbi:WSC domain-containing protein [Exophiala viscosa]|uniref:WSC domain-containing protein n=1 Tax=Exophiala viscosa TaxID=2486360 RepID=UPI00219186FA|nr:WSC domain-containing protein [Exophiala viscosa]
MKTSISVSLALSLGSWLGLVNAYWRMTCSVAQTGRVDPILSPGSVSGHVHLLSGATNVNTTSDYDTLSVASCTTCSVQKDLSAYWTPLMYYQFANGSLTPVPNDGTVVYYLGRGVDVANAIPFPKGLKMVSGDSTVRSYDNTTMTYGNSTYPSRPVADRVSFVCIDYTNETPQTTFLNNTDCPDGLRAQIQFQSCWDGVNLYKSDQSHVAYLSQIDNGACPPTHPYLMPHLFFEIYYFPNSMDTSDGGQFVFSNGDTTGYGFHGDFMDGWDNDVLTEAVAQCLVNDTDGVISECAPLEASQDDYYANNCPERPALVDEQVKGILSKLPGCNNVTSGPEAAPQGICSTEPSLITPEDTDGETRVKPTINSTTVTMSSGSTATYYGCYIDETSGRALSGASTTNSTGMTTALCGAYCQNKGYSVFGTEYSDECYCGSSISASYATNETGCAMACIGNLTEYCGGSARLSVWLISGNETDSSTSSGPTVANSTYISCYSDGTSGRTLTTRTTDSSMTLAECASIAQTSNYKYFGLEYSDECWVGNTLASTGTTLAEGKCDMTCAGNTSEICGGSNALSLFQNKLYEQPGNPSTVNITGKSAQFGYLGCYTEGTSGRALGGSSSYSTTSSSMTVELCVAACYARGYDYAGVEYSDECYCNNIGITNGATTASSGCSMICDGNVAEYCGGSNRVNVYELKNSTSASRLARREQQHSRRFMPSHWFGLS